MSSLHSLPVRKSSSADGSRNLRRLGSLPSAPGIAANHATAVPVSSSRRDLIRQVQERLQTAGFIWGH